MATCVLLGHAIIPHHHHYEEKKHHLGCESISAIENEHHCSEDEQHIHAQSKGNHHECSECHFNVDPIPVLSIGSFNLDYCLFGEIQISPNIVVDLFKAFLPPEQYSYCFHFSGSSRAPPLV